MLEGSAKGSEGGGAVSGSKDSGLLESQAILKVQLSLPKESAKSDVCRALKCGINESIQNIYCIYTNTYYSCKHTHTYESVSQHTESLQIISANLTLVAQRRVRAIVVCGSARASLAVCVCV